MRSWRRRFIELYGDQFDRVGGETGAFLGVPPGATFGQRALPPNRLNYPVRDYSFTGDLPEGVTIEVSEIAPAFGRPGGGIQVRFIDTNGKEIAVEDLRNDGLLK